MKACQLIKELAFFSYASEIVAVSDRHHAVLELAGWEEIYELKIWKYPQIEESWGFLSMAIWKRYKTRAFCAIMRYVK